jgi:hypothetical protein
MLIVGGTSTLFVYFVQKKTKQKVHRKSSGSSKKTLLFYPEGLELYYKAEGDFKFFRVSSVHRVQ